MSKPWRSLLVTLFINHPDVGQIARKAVNVESVADNEIGRNLETDIIGGDVGLKRFGFEEKSCNLHIAGILRFEIFHQITDCATGVNDIFNDNDRAALNILCQTHHFLDNAGAFRSFIALQANERNFSIGQLNAAKQVGRKRKSSVENTKKQRTLTATFAGDLFAKFLYVVVTELPMVRLPVNPSQRKKASSPIVVTDSGMVRLPVNP